MALVQRLWSLLALLALAGSHAATPLKPGDTFPDLAAFALEGELPATQGKVLLVDFWASWCAPCKRSFPVMKELQEKFGARGFLIIAISVDEKKAEMEKFLAKNAPPFAVVRDAKGRAAEALGVETMPTSYLVRADGRLAAVHKGFEGEATRREYIQEIEAALAGAGK